MRISVRTLNGEAAELDLDPRTTVAELRLCVERALRIPALEQRFVYAGIQLEEVSSAAWRARRSSGAAVLGLGLAELPDGTPLTLELHGLQKGSVINVVRRTMPASSLPARAPEPQPALRRSGSDEPGAEPEGEESTHEFEPRLSGFAVHAAGPAQTRQELHVAPGGGYAGLPEVGAGGAGLALALQALSDMALVSLLQPLLQQRPAVRAALQLEERSPGQYLVPAVHRPPHTSQPTMPQPPLPSHVPASSPSAATAPATGAQTYWHSGSRPGGRGAWRAVRRGPGRFRLVQLDAALVRG